MPYIYFDELPQDFDLPDGFTPVTAYSEDDYNSVVSERDNLQSAFDKATNDILSLQDNLKAEKAKFAKAFLNSSSSKTDEPKKSMRKVSTVDNIWG